MSEQPLRDHGYQKIGTGGPEDVIGPPIVLSEFADHGAACPHCGCEKLFLIEVELAKPATPPRLRVPEGSKVIGIYPGCPACPWAGPMMTTARAKK
jgi:hypothetical protein